VSEFAVAEIKPDYVAFLATEASLPTIQNILQTCRIQAHKIFFVKNIFSTEETIQEFFNAFQWLKAQGNMEEMCIEATNCITVLEMSTYVCASMLDLFREIIGEQTVFKLMYVHCDYAIGPTGVAAEVRGSEKLVELERPTESLSFVLSVEAIRAFNAGRYEHATETFQALASSTRGERSLFYGCLAQLARSYDYWDKMHIAAAQEALIEAAQQRTKSFGAASALGAHSECNARALARLNDGLPESIIIDLYENAMRRERSRNYDDALARLYACIERMVQYRLKKHGIETKDPAYNMLPPNLVEQFHKQVGALPDELELKKGMLLLTIIGDDFGQPVKEMTYKTFVGLIGMRNTSILAHGIKPVSHENFQQFKKVLAAPLFKRFCELESIGPEQVSDHHHMNIPGMQELFYQPTPTVRKNLF
jgi:CRISPR-associated protein (TIGR02710 family)